VATEVELTPCPPDPTELGYLRWAVRRARVFRFSEEFAEGYRNYRAIGDDVYAAAWCALCDWGMLDA
jgi:hypothetical protein